VQEKKTQIQADKPFIHCDGWFLVEVVKSSDMRINEGYYPFTVGSYVSSKMINTEYINLRSELTM